MISPMDPSTYYNPNPFLQSSAGASPPPQSMTSSSSMKFPDTKSLIYQILPLWQKFFRILFFAHVQEKPKQWYQYVLGKKNPETTFDQVLVPQINQQVQSFFDSFQHPEEYLNSLQRCIIHAFESLLSEIPMTQRWKDIKTDHVFLSLADSLSFEMIQFMTVRFPLFSQLFAFSNLSMSVGSPLVPTQLRKKTRQQQKMQTSNQLNNFLQFQNSSSSSPQNSKEILMEMESLLYRQLYDLFLKYLFGVEETTRSLFLQYLNQYRQRKQRQKTARQQLRQLKTQSTTRQQKPPSSSSISSSSFFSDGKKMN